MKVVDVIISTGEIPLNALGDRYFKNSEKFGIKVYTDEGVFDYTFEKDSISNFRSGAPFIDHFVPHIGSKYVQAAWWVHDFNYTPCRQLNMHHPVSKELADEILLAMLLFARRMDSKSINKAQVYSAYYAVKWFGRKAYEEDDKLTDANSQKFTFAWTAK